MIKHSQSCMPPLRTVLASSPSLQSAAVRSFQSLSAPQKTWGPTWLQHSNSSSKFRPSSTACLATETLSLAGSAPEATTPSPLESSGTFTLKNGQTYSYLTNGQERPPLAPGLYLVGTPIGNLEDITLRALRVLRECHAILAEDTRHSGRLLQSYGITTRLHSYHAHNEKAKEDQVLQLLGSGQAVALISDAGMPLISDPGAGLVRRVAQQGVAVHPIPGPSAPLAALVASGLATDRFQFCGFLPPKQGARLEAIKKLKGCSATLLFFAPPHSLVPILGDLARVLGESRPCVIARELTKMHEEFYRGSLEEAHGVFSSRVPRGEITIVVAGEVEGESGAEAGVADSDIEERLADLLVAGCSSSSAAKLLSKELKLSKNRIYGIVNGLNICTSCKEWKQNRQATFLAQEPADSDAGREHSTSVASGCPLCARKAREGRGE